MTGYGTRQVAQILGLSAGQVRSYVRAGFLSPERGPGGRFQFSFPDLVFLRTARGLSEAKIPARRIRGALRQLRRDLPESRRLTDVRIVAEGKRIVVADGAERWQPESGQTLFDFGLSELALAAGTASLSEAASHGVGGKASAEDWQAFGSEREADAPEEAAVAYRKALELDPALADAHVNLGRLLHEHGEAAAAEAHYREALALRPRDATAAFNLGVALEDLGREKEALAAYQRALELDPEDADAHFNAAGVCERIHDTAAALRHWKSYRQLTRPAK